MRHERGRSRMTTIAELGSFLAREAAAAAPALPITDSPGQPRPLLDKPALGNSAPNGNPVGGRT